MNSASAGAVPEIPVRTVSRRAGMPHLPGRPGHRQAYGNAGPVLAWLNLESKEEVNDRNLFRVFHDFATPKRKKSARTGSRNSPAFAVRSSVSERELSLPLLDRIFERMHRARHFLADAAFGLIHREHHGVEAVVLAVARIIVGDVHRAMLVGHIARG